ncbi:MAG TPA: hypothetical protein VEC36_01965 [Patescibacteria group bacterium]|nr:hypothetical protein [Patescibacteria group bacterium]
MKKFLKNTVIQHSLVCCFTLLAAQSLQAQFIEDGLRLSQSNGYITPRAGGLGVAYHGVADDFAALYYNPAGLSLLGRSEVTLGLGFMRNATETHFLQNYTPFQVNSTAVTHAGFSAPFKINGKNAAISIGYALENNFDNIVRFNGFNTTSSIIPDLNTVASERQLADLFLGGFVNNKFVTPLRDSLQQNANVQESGGIHTVSGGAGFDLTDWVSAGFAVTAKGGQYKYSRRYTETDVNNKYNSFDDVNYTNIDFQSLDIRDDLTQDIEGISATLGVQGKIANFMRIGVTVKSPTFYQVKERFSTEITTRFDNADQYNLPAEEFTNSYNFTTPFIFGAGLSFNALGMTFSAGAEYNDVTQMEFTDAPTEVMDRNFEAIETLNGQTTWGVGVEYEVPVAPVVVRASYTTITSPYKEDVAGANARIAALGAGIYLASNIRLDGMFRWTDVSQLRANYGNGSGSQYIMQQRPLNIALQLTYRY